MTSHSTLTPAESHTVVDASAPLTPGQARAAHKARKRSEATAAGRPIRRTRQPGVYLAGTVGHFVYSDAGRLMEVEVSLPATLDPSAITLTSFGETAIPVPAPAKARMLSFDRLAEIVRDAYEVEARTGAIRGVEVLRPVGIGTSRIAVVADKQTLTLMSRMADTAAKTVQGDQAEVMSVRSIAKALTYRAALPHSGFLPVLTLALASHYWMPSAGDETSFVEWADAFGKGHAPMREQFAFLLAAAIDGPDSPKYVKQMLSSEKYGTISSQYGGALSSSKAFKNANGVAGAHAAILNTDPLLAEFNMLSGEVAKIRIVKKNDGSFTATVSDPFKLKPGSQVLLFDLDSDVGSASEADLTSVDYVAGSDSLLAKFSKGKRHGKTWWLVEQAAQNHRPLYAVTLPFVGSGSRTRITGKWAKPYNATAEAAADPANAQRKPVERDVPVDIALAGAPETR